MNYHKTASLGWIATALFLIGCVASQLPVSIPAVRVPSVPTLSPITLPTVSAPPIGLTALPIPTISVPGIGLTLVNGVVNTPVPTMTSIPAVPVTGNQLGSQILAWVIYGLLALVGIVVVIALFARAMRHTEGPTEPPDKPDI